MFFDFLQKQHVCKKSGSWIFDGPKTSKQIRMQDSLNYNISQKDFRHEVEFFDMTRGPRKH